MEVAGDEPDDDGAASPAVTAEPLELEDGARCFCKPSRLFATFGAFRSHCAAKHAGLPLRPVRADGGAVPLAAYATRERLNALTRAKKKSPAPRDPSALREACETIDWEKRGGAWCYPADTPSGYGSDDDVRGSLARHRERLVVPEGGDEFEEDDLVKAVVRDTFGDLVAGDATSFVGNRHIYRAAPCADFAEEYLSWLLDAARLHGVTAAKAAADCVEINQRDLFYLAPEQASKSITGLKAFAMQVHYDNRNNIRNVVDRSGFRLHYSTRAREAATGSVIGQRLSYSNALQIPAGASRWFLTRTCEITGATDDVNLFSANFHAHLLGAEMYAELWRDGERTTIHNDGAWFFDDQYDRNLEERGLVLKNGDVLQSTCVMDASARSSSTRFGVETTDEMCWVTLSYWPLQSTLRCDGDSWTGTLEPGEPAEVIPVTHPNDGYDCFDYDITSSENEYSCARLAGMDHRDFCAELFCPACAYAHYCDESCGFCLPDFAEEVVACDADELAVLERDDAAAVDAINAMCAPHSDETPVAECEWLILHVQKCAEVDGHPDISENLAYKLDNLGTVADVIRAANVGVHHLYGEDAPIVDGAASPAPFLLSAALGAVALFC